MTGSDKVVVDAVEPVVSELAEPAGSGGSGSLLPRDGGGGSAVAVGAEPGDAAMVVEGGSSEPASSGSGDGVGVGGETGSAGDADPTGNADVPTGDGGPVRSRSLPVGGVAPNAQAAQEELLVDPVTGCYVDDFACIDRETARTSTTTTAVPRTTRKPAPSTTLPPATTIPHSRLDPNPAVADDICLRPDAVPDGEGGCKILHDGEWGCLSRNCASGQPTPQEYRQRWTDLVGKLNDTHPKMNYLVVATDFANNRVKLQAPESPAKWYSLSTNGNLI